MRLRAMCHSTVQVVRQPNSRPAHVTPPAITVGRVSAALLPAVLGDPSTASPVPAGILGQRGEPGLLTAREQDDGKPPS